MRLIDVDELIKKINDKGKKIIISLPVEEILGEDVDMDDFAMLVQEAVQMYRNMVIGVIQEQPIAYDVEAKVVEAINEVVLKYNNDWIPCDKALPKEKGTYLVTSRKFGITFARFTGEKHNLHFDSDVIAWQPLPPAYEESCSEIPNE